MYSTTPNQDISQAYLQQVADLTMASVNITTAGVVMTKGQNDNLMMVTKAQQAINDSWNNLTIKRVGVNDAMMGKWDSILSKGAPGSS